MDMGETDMIKKSGHLEEKPQVGENSANSFPHDDTNNILIGEQASQYLKGIQAEFLSIKVYFLKYEYRDKDMTWGIMMILLCTLLSIICLVLNSFVFKFYKKKARNDVVALLYSLLSFSDNLVAVGCCTTVICLIQYLSLDLKDKEKDFVYPSVKYLCYCSFFVSSIAIRISIFLNAMLSIVRTMMIRNPFSEPSKRGICIAFGMITFFWTMMTAGEVYTLKEYSIELHWSQYMNETGAEHVEEDAKNRKQYLYLWYYIYTSAAGYNHLAKLLGDWFPWSAGLYTNYRPSGESGTVKEICEHGSLYGMFLIAFVVPCLISVACLFIKALYLRRPSVGGTENNNNKVTNTVVMLTIVFVVCNTINIVIISIALWYPEWMHSKKPNTDTHESEVQKISRLALKSSPASDMDGIKVSPKVTTIDEIIIRFYRIMFTVQQVLPLLNSTLSPMILIWRGSALWKFSKKSLVKVYSKVYPRSETQTFTLSQIQD
jgi:hypothetical protein